MTRIHEASAVQPHPGLPAGSGRSPGGGSHPLTTTVLALCAQSDPQRYLTAAALKATRECGESCGSQNATTSVIRPPTIATRPCTIPCVGAILGGDHGAPSAHDEGRVRGDAPPSGTFQPLLPAGSLGDAHPPTPAPWRASHSAAPGTVRPVGSRSGPRDLAVIRTPSCSVYGCACERQCPGVVRAPCRIRERHHRCR